MSPWMLTDGVEIANVEKFESTLERVEALSLRSIRGANSLR